VSSSGADLVRVLALDVAQRDDRALHVRQRRDRVLGDAHRLAGEKPLLWQLVEPRSSPASAPSYTAFYSGPGTVRSL
jgi:hypothetical protein